jgi:integrase/recombinase XerD
MFDQLYQRPSTIARHASAPFAKERARYLEYCKRRGDTAATLALKARELLWIARKLRGYPDLDVTMEQLCSVAAHWRDRESACGHKLNGKWTSRRFIDVAGTWLRYLGHLRPPVEPIPFQTRLEEYRAWAKDERGLAERTIEESRNCIKQFLCWYGELGRPLSSVRVDDIDAFLAQKHEEGCCRVTLQNVAGILRRFFRYGSDQGWWDSHLASAIQGPRIYSLEGLPAGPSWKDVQRMFGALDPDQPTDVRDRAILMLLSIYGLRASEVAKLCLDDVDWEHDLLRVQRAKRRGVQTYPLLPSVGDALVEYLQTVRRHSTRREIFLSMVSPHQPLSRGGLYSLVARRLKPLNVPTAHHGPHSLRHACAARLVAEGLTLKEVGDHLGHRCTAATRIYAKTDLVGLREIAAFDLGELS